MVLENPGIQPLHEFQFIAAIGNVQINAGKSFFFAVCLHPAQKRRLSDPPRRKQQHVIGLKTAPEPFNLIGAVEEILALDDLACYVLQHSCCPSTKSTTTLLYNRIVVNATSCVYIAASFRTSKLGRATLVNGKVYPATFSGTLNVYGLLAKRQPFTIRRRLSSNATIPIPERIKLPGSGTASINGSFDPANGKNSKETILL